MGNLRTRAATLFVPFGHRNRATSNATEKSSNVGVPLSSPMSAPADLEKAQIDGLIDGRERTDTPSSNSRTLYNPPQDQSDSTHPPLRALPSEFSCEFLCPEKVSFAGGSTS